MDFVGLGDARDYTHLADKKWIPFNNIHYNWEDFFLFLIPAFGFMTVFKVFVDFFTEGLFFFAAFLLEAESLPVDALAF